MTSYDKQPQSFVNNIISLKPIIETPASIFLTLYAPLYVDSIIICPMVMTCLKINQQRSIHFLKLFRILFFISVYCTPRQQQFLRCCSKLSHHSESQTLKSFYSKSQSLCFHRNIKNSNVERFASFRNHFWSNLRKRKEKISR